MGRIAQVQIGNFLIIPGVDQHQKPVQITGPAFFMPVELIDSFRELKRTFPGLPYSPDSPCFHTVANRSRLRILPRPEIFNPEENLNLTIALQPGKTNPTGFNPSRSVLREYMPFQPRILIRRDIFRQAETPGKNPRDLFKIGNFYGRGRLSRIAGITDISPEPNEEAHQYNPLKAGEHEIRLAIYSPIVTLKNILVF